MKRVIVVHGWEGSPEGNWFPWLKRELEAQDVVVEVPTMPDTMHPTQDAWVAHLSEIVGEPDTETILIGHSLGVIAILRYLESLPEGKQVGGVISVAGFSESLQKEALTSFFTRPLDYEKVRTAVQGDIVAFQSDNDPYVPMEQAGYFQSRLSAEVITIRGGGHLNVDDGYMEFPKLLEVLKSINTGSRE